MGAEATILKEFTRLSGEVQAVADKFSAELEKRDTQIREHGETSAATAMAVGKFQDQLKSLCADIKGLQTNWDSLKGQGPDRSGGGSVSVKSIGQQFIESSQYKEWAQSESSKNSGSYRCKHIFTPHGINPGLLKAIDVDGEAALRSVLTTTRLAQIYGEPLRSQRVRDAIPVLPTSQGSIVFLRETLFDNQAAPVAQGALKPESGFDFIEDTTPVRTIAHTLKVPKQLLDDAVMLEGYLNTRMIEGLKLEEDRQLLYGTGLSEDLKGLLTVAGRQQLTQLASETKIDTIMRAITMVSLSHYMASVIIMSAQDWQDVVLTKGDDGHYIFGNVVTNNQPRLWGLPVIVTTAMAAGQCLVGALNMAATIWDREQAGVEITNSNEDDFRRNRLCIRVEERLAQTIYRPLALVDVTFVPNS